MVHRIRRGDNNENLKDLIVQNEKLKDLIAQILDKTGNYNTMNYVHYMYFFSQTNSENSLYT